MNRALHQMKKEAIMEKCFDCYAENGLTGKRIKALVENYKNDGEVQGVAGNNQHAEEEALERWGAAFGRPDGPSAAARRPEGQPGGRE